MILKSEKAKSGKVWYIGPWGSWGGNIFKNNTIAKLKTKSLDDWFARPIISHSFSPYKSKNQDLKSITGIIHMMKKTVIIFFFVYISLVMAKGQTKVDLGQRPIPSIVVSLEKNKIGVNDPLKVVLWISNQSDYDLIDIKLHLSGPDFLKWSEKKDSQTIKSPFELSTNIAKHATFRKTLYTSIKLQDEVNAGEVNILFAVEYKWKSGKIINKSVATIKEIIKIDILGIDNILGIPIGLVCLFLPGAILLLFLSLFQVPLKILSQREWQIIFSIIFSVVVFVLLIFIKQLFQWQILKTMNINLSISIEKLLILTTSGLILGLIGGLLYRLKKWLIQKRKSYRSINARDAEDYTILIKKILALSSEQLELAAFVQKKDGSRYIGAHYAELEDNIYLVGTFQVDRQQLDHSGIPMEPPLNNKKSMMKLIKKIASKKEITIEIREPIEFISQNGEKSYTTECFMHFARDKVDDYAKISSKKRNLLELIG